MADAAAPLAGAATHALGRTDYETTWRAMQSFTSTRTPETRDEIWLTEHPPVYTLGLAGRREHLLRDNGIPALKVDRGGQVTYHGPGQLVAYLLFDLKRRGMGIRAMVRSIEASIVEWLDSMGISAYGKPAAPGVYVMVAGTEAKIAALGLKVSKGCTYHGLALNVAMDLAPFADIDPCGFKGLAVTQLADLGVVRTVEEAGAELAPVIAARFA
jgi:lipoyl(octanoyl) transferase